MANSKRATKADKSKRPSARASAVVESKQPTVDQVRERAYQIYLARGGEESNPVVDWIEAETQLGRGRG